MGAAENKTMRAILEYLAYRGVFAWRNNNAPTYDSRKGVFRRAISPPGAPDIIGVMPGDGRFLGIEVKTRTGRVSPSQETFLSEIRASGGRAFVARSVRDVEEYL